MEIYLVGGAVRDQLLELPITDRDWVVIGGSVEEMQKLGFRRVPGGFPVFIHPETGEEYALARREVKVGPGYHGFVTETGADVTLEEDLQRRDLTINAMAMDRQQRLIDPWNGEEDLANGLLKHVTEAFQEDPVRVLRVARFAAKLGQWGFRVAHGTHGLMKKMVRSDDFSSLKRERFLEEMTQALASNQPWRFFQVLHRCGALAKLLPSMDRLLVPGQGHAATDHAPFDWLRLAVKRGCSTEIRFLAAMAPFLETKADLIELETCIPLTKRYRLLLQRLLIVKRLYPELLNASASDLHSFYKVYFGRQGKPQSELVELSHLMFPQIWEQTENQLLVLHQAISDIDVEAIGKRGLSGASYGQALEQAQLDAIKQIQKKRENR